MQLLNKGLKYNLHHKHKQWIQTLASDADTTICLLPDKDQPYVRQLVASNIKKILNNHNILTFIGRGI
jgi:ketol-acid reductoisomerase